MVDFFGAGVCFFVFWWKTNEKRNFNEIGDAVQIQKNKWSNDLELTRMLSGRRFSRVEPRDGFISSKNKEPKKYRGVLPSYCFGQLGGRRRSCFAYIDSELKMQSLSQRAWRFVFFSPRVYLALQHPSFSIFTSEVFLPSNHKGGWILSSFFFYVDIILKLNTTDPPESSVMSGKMI